MSELPGLKYRNSPKPPLRCDHHGRQQSVSCCPERASHGKQDSSQPGSTICRSCEAKAIGFSGIAGVWNAEVATDESLVSIELTFGGLLADFACFWATSAETTGGRSSASTALNPDIPLIAEASNSPPILLLVFPCWEFIVPLPTFSLNSAKRKYCGLGFHLPAPAENTAYVGCSSAHPPLEISRKSLQTDIRRDPKTRRKIRHFTLWQINAIIS